ncbi:MAG: phosphatase PAP2 family protein [Pontixanthobacter sp.]
MLAQPAFASSEKDWASASDVGVGALMTWSLGVPLMDGDTQGALQAGGSLAASAAIAQSMKQVVHETRPDGSDRRSFPSGHTSMAFGAATSILERRGSKEGIPALALAGFVGLARVEADKHYWHDVAAGAAFGTLSGLLITHPKTSNEVTMVWGDAHSVGLSYAARF